MRVTFSMTYEKMMLNLNRKQEDTSRLSLMVGSGKRMSKPQEDPMAWSQAMDMKQGLREITAFNKNVDFAVGWNQTATSALNQLSDLLIKAREIGLSTTIADTADERAAQIESVGMIADQALGLANTQYNDLYIFSGKAVNTAPFSAGNLNYQGDTGAFEVRVGKGNRETINLDGESVFITDPTDPATNILKRLEALKSALQAGDMTEVQNQTAALETAQEHIGAKNSVVGARLSNMENQKSYLATLELDNKTQLSEVEDTDMVETITQLQQKRTVLEAALQVTAMIDDLNLARFL